MEPSENIYIKELKEHIGKEVTVVDHNKEKIKGICLSVNFTHLNVNLRVKYLKKSKVVTIKNIARIERVEDE